MLPTYIPAESAKVPRHSRCIKGFISSNSQLSKQFNPNITKYEEIFKQEGWHYELTGKDDELKINGVVYNEMKGAYSSPDEVLSSQIYRSLFPDNTYSKDSGGNPE